MKERITAADIAVINQETILGGEELGYSGYPTFNSPTQIGDAIAKAGFDVVLQASNHAMDKGKQGIKNTLEFWKKYPEISVLGIHQSQKDQRNVCVIEKNNIKIALLNATYGLNGITLSNENAFRVDILKEGWMKEQIKEAKEMADVVVVFAHWGTEYVYKADEVQKKWTDFFADQGVDLVIGSHPHVIQPAEWVEGKQGNRMLVYYSLGNYISYQKKAPRMLGEMAEVTFTKTEGGVKITEASVTPIVTHYEKKSDYQFATYLLSDYTQELALKHGVLEKEENSPFSLEYLKDLSTKVLGDWKKINIK
jgi:poly-gamma-glutamate synthesis protein (capsule biosynthesis protein)